MLNPETISIPASLGTIEVNADGPFTYTAPTKIASGTYVTFYYKATDGRCVSNQALVKIQVACKCRVNAPDLTLCGATEVDETALMARGAGCLGCRDVTPVFDLSQVGTETGIAYPYTVSCPGCTKLTGHVTLLPECEITWDDFSTCYQDFELEDIITKGHASCGPCDLTPKISEYPDNVSPNPLIICESECGTVTEEVQLTWLDCFLDPFPDFTWCSEDLPTEADIAANVSVSCESCDGTPVISDIHWIWDWEGVRWGEYSVTCQSECGPVTTGGQFNNESCPCLGIDC